jgi:chromosomal replication initiator protein
VKLDQRLRFDNYVVGAGNRLAVAAARAVAESPGSVYNPLFIYGGTGLGKTHLLGGIGRLAEALQENLEIEYLSLEEFVDQLHAAISAGQLEAFSSRYERVGLLLIDDVQFLTGRRETQAALLKLFERMQRAGGQIVLTSDRPPSEISDVDERLISRLSGGLIVDVTVPDYETRVAILRANCEERRIEFRGGVLEELARFSFTNVRELHTNLRESKRRRLLHRRRPTGPPASSKVFCPKSLRWCNSMWSHGRPGSPKPQNIGRVRAIAPRYLNVP